MMNTVLAVFALVGAAVAAPVSHFVNIKGMTMGGSAFESQGKTTAGAAADADSGVAAGGVMGKGSVIGIAGPGMAAAAGLLSPTL